MVSSVIRIDQDDHSDRFFALLQSPEPSIVCFSSKSDKDCSSFSKIFELVAGNRQECAFIDADIDHNPALAAEFKIDTLPTIMLFRESVVLFEHAGLLSVADLEGVLDKALHLDMCEVRAEIRDQYE